MKNKFFISIFCLLLLAQANLNAQIEDPEEEQTTEGATPPVIDQQNTMQPYYIKLVHSGAYVAKYQIGFNVNGEDKIIEISDKTSGYSETFNVPFTATNIWLKGWAMTGLVWDPWGEIYNKSMGGDDLNKCYKNFGTTLNRGWDNNCNL